MKQLGLLLGKRGCLLPSNALHAILPYPEEFLLCQLWAHTQEFLEHLSAAWAVGSTTLKSSLMSPYFPALLGHNVLSSLLTQPASCPGYI